VFTRIDPPDSVFTEAIGINDRGEIADTFNIGSLTESFVLSHRHYKTIAVDFPGAYNTNVFGINNQGRIVGEYILPPPPQFFPHGFIGTPTDDERETAEEPAP
jgi:hypothetical protein